MTQDHGKNTADRPRRVASLIAIAALAVACGGCGQNTGKSAPPPSGAEAPPVAESPLAKAATQGNLGDLRDQLDSGADIDSRDALGRTPLHIAAFYGWPKTTELLVSRGADVNARDRVGMTPLHAAVISGGRAEVELLLRRGADITARSEAGQTALHLSAATGQPKLSKYLIDQGADPRSQDSNGKTPLFYAEQNKHPQTIALLQQYADTDQRPDRP